MGRGGDTTSFKAQILELLETAYEHARFKAACKLGHPRSDFPATFRHTG